MLHISAYLFLLLALLVALGCSGLSLLQLYEGRPTQLRLIRGGQYVVSGSLLLSSALLLHALFWEDYSLEYVSSYTDKFLPVFYRLTAFWAGQPGSMLFWALVTALTGTAYALSSRSREEDDPTQLWFWAFFYAIMAFFCLVLTCWSNPFMVQEPAPMDGNGLNPLLQNPGMIFHPPLLFMGYAGFTVPACLGMAQLMSGAEPGWYRETRVYYILSWCLLTAGIILGAWWAYMELGWGGYWAWDPVENASLLPWLVGSAALHIIIVQARAGKLNRLAVALMSLTVTSAFFATYLTRSGVIQSVHAFGDGGVGTPLTIFVLAALLLSLAAPLLGKSRGNELGNPFSREGALMLVCWLFLALAMIILIATMWPVISNLWGAAPQGLDASFYNRVCLPLGVGLLLLLCICFWLRWQGGIEDRGRFYATCGAFFASGVAIFLAGYQKPLALIASAASIGAICAIFMQLPGGRWNLRRLGALGLHLGLALLALGIAFSGPYTIDKELLLSRGQQDTIGPYVVSLEGLKDGEGPGYDFLQATLKISENSETLGILRPERRIYAKFGEMQFSEVDVISGLGRDIYASLLGMDEDLRVLVKISLEPMVNWIWIGGALMCLAPLLGLWRRKKGNG